MSRGAMTQRAAVSRNTETGTNEWGTPEVPIFAEVATGVPCRAWSKMRREVRDDGKLITVEDLRAMIPVTADIDEGDRLVITDRLGATIFGGPVAVLAISPWGQSPSGSATSGHKELVLARHTGA